MFHFPADAIRQHVLHRTAQKHSDGHATCACVIVDCADLLSGARRAASRPCREDRWSREACQSAAH